MGKVKDLMMGDIPEIPMFTAPTEAIKRDRWGRPLIEPVGGGKAIPYTRVSTLAKALDDKTALTKWMQRMVLQGVTARPDLVALAAAAQGDPKQLSGIVEQAMSAAESDRAANLGTAIHTFTERIDEGKPLDTFPIEHRADLAAYQAAMSSIEIVATELFVVTDEVEAAGTFDRLVRLPDGRVMVADVKTGANEDKYPHGVATQIAIYSHGHLYDPKEGRKAHLPTVGVSTDTGLLIHMPVNTGTCNLYLIDLTTGWKLAQTAVAVRKAFKQKPLTPYTP